MFHVYKKLQDSISSKSCIVILHGGLLEITLKLKMIDLYTKTRLISNKSNRMLLTLVSPGCIVQCMQQVSFFKKNIIKYFLCLQLHCCVF